VIKKRTKQKYTIGRIWFIFEFILFMHIN